MNSDSLQGNWHQLKGSIRAKWGELTDDDLQEIDGNAERLAGKLQERYGLARDEAERQADQFFKEHS